MTAAEAIETSVTTINSLSQDFTNLDDQPSRTLTDTPWFKPFTLNTIYLIITVTFPSLPFSIEGKNVKEWKR